MDWIWAAGGPVSATQVRDGLADRELALTTVHTVLGRLEQKGFLVHDDAARGGSPRAPPARSTRPD
ncbi:hypothetical protein A7K94_0213970 [Modestobacter sp. VKM Ac-2676]|nr:hypothetical protein A7K94_0213970 [Modestobacter sp. VKM Ac-2676]